MRLRGKGRPQEDAARRQGRRERKRARRQGRLKGRRGAHVVELAAASSGARARARTHLLALRTAHRPVQRPQPGARHVAHHGKERRTRLCTRLHAARGGTRARLTSVWRACTGTTRASTRCTSPAARSTTSKPPSSVTCARSGRGVTQAPHSAYSMSRHATPGVLMYTVPRKTAAWRTRRNTSPRALACSVMRTTCSLARRARTARGGAHGTAPGSCARIGSGQSSRHAKWSSGSSCRGKRT